MYLWAYFWNRIETLHTPSWISVKLSREYLVHLSWIKLTSNPCGLDSSTSRAADRNPEGASSNPAWVNNFQLASAVSDYHEEFLFIITLIRTKTKMYRKILKSVRNVTFFCSFCFLSYLLTCLLGFESFRVGAIGTPRGGITLSLAYRTKLALPQSQR